MDVTYSAVSRGNAFEDTVTLPDIAFAFFNIVEPSIFIRLRPVSRPLKTVVDMYMTATFDINPFLNRFFGDAKDKDGNDGFRLVLDFRSLQAIILIQLIHREFKAHLGKRKREILILNSTRNNSKYKHLIHIIVRE